MSDPSDHSLPWGPAHSFLREQPLLDDLEHQRLQTPYFSALTPAARRAQDYRRGAATQARYAATWRHFVAWMRSTHGDNASLADISPSAVANYMAELARDAPSDTTTFPSALRSVFLLFNLQPFTSDVRLNEQAATYRALHKNPRYDRFFNPLVIFRDYLGRQSSWLMPLADLRRKLTTLLRLDLACRADCLAGLFRCGYWISSNRTAVTLQLYGTKELPPRSWGPYRRIAAFPAAPKICTVDTLRAWVTRTQGLPLAKDRPIHSRGALPADPPSSHTGTLLHALRPRHGVYHSLSPDTISNDSGPAIAIASASSNTVYSGHALRGAALSLSLAHGATVQRASEAASVTVGTINKWYRRPVDDADLYPQAPPSMPFSHILRRPLLPQANASSSVGDD